MRRHFVIALGMGVVVAALASGCTFGGLADYDTPECDPTLPHTKDPCEALNAGRNRCPMFHCNASTRHCTATVESERCDGVDNDCNGAVDDDLLTMAKPRAEATAIPADAVDVSLARGGSSGEVYAAYVAGACVRAFASSIGASGVPSSAPIDFACDEATPLREPFVAPLATPSRPTVALAAVDVAARCPGGVVEYTSGGPKRVAVSQCGASLPSLASFAGGDQAVVAYYMRPFVAADSAPTDDCAVVAPAALRVAWVQRAASVEPVATIFATADENTASVRPPALLAVGASDYVLLASPTAAGVRLWALGKDVLAAPPLVPVFADPLPASTDARAVAMAVGGAGADTRVAIVASLGCGDAQKIALYLARYDRVTSAASPIETVEVAPPGTGGSAPSVAWVDARAEWWVSWKGHDASGPVLRMRRFAADGKAASSTSDIGSGVAAFFRGTEGAHFGSPVVVASRSSVVETDIGCP